MKRPVKFGMLAVLILFFLLSFVAIPVMAESSNEEQAAVTTTEAIETTGNVVTENALSTEVQEMQVALATTEDQTIMLAAKAPRTAPVSAVAEKKEKSFCDKPGLSIACVPHEFFGSFFKTPFDKKAGWFERIIPLCWLGNALGNSLDRIGDPIVGEERPLYEKGYIVNFPSKEFPIARDTMGGAGAGVLYGAASGVGNTLFGVANRMWGWLVTGTAAGAGTSVVEYVTEKK